MINMPIIKGMVMTDEEGTIAIKKDGKNQIIHPGKKESMALDKQILRTFINDHIENSTLFVLGKNTFVDMNFIFEDAERCGFLLSSKEGWNYCTSNENLDADVWSNDWSSRKSLLYKANEIALKNRYFDIVVLGGKSVYESFAGHYRELHHVKFKEIVEGEDSEKTKIDVSYFGNDPKVNTLMSFSNSKFYLESRMVHIDTSEFRYETFVI